MGAIITCSCGLECRTRAAAEQHAVDNPTGHHLVLHEEGRDPFKRGEPRVTIAMPRGAGARMYDLVRESLRSMLIGLRQEAMLIVDDQHLPAISERIAHEIVGAILLELGPGEHGRAQPDQGRSMSMDARLEHFEREVANQLASVLEDMLHLDERVGSLEQLAKREATT
jgi:hypothetical protein